VSDEFPQDICSRCGITREGHSIYPAACDSFTQEYQPHRCPARHGITNERCLVTAKHDIHRAWSEADGSRRWRSE
jgi:hypothetical protein